MANLTQFHLDCHKLFDGVKLFPIEMDLAKSAFQTSDSAHREFHDNVSDGEEAREAEGDERILNLDTEESQGDLLTQLRDTQPMAEGGSENLQLLSGIGNTQNQNNNPGPETATLLDL